MFQQHGLESVPFAFEFFSRIFPKSGTDIVAGFRKPASGWTLPISQALASESGLCSVRLIKLFPSSTPRSIVPFVTARRGLLGFVENLAEMRWNQETKLLDGKEAKVETMSLGRAGTT